MAVSSEEKIIFDCVRKNGIDKLNEFKKSDKDVAFLSLKVENISHMKEFIQAFPNVTRLEIATRSMEGEEEDDLCGKYFPKLRNVIFLTPIPKNLWSIFMNLKEICFGVKGHIELFSSEFINEIIDLNKTTLTKLELIHIAVDKTSYQPLRIPCQLEELDIKFCFDGLIEEIVRNEKERMLDNSLKGNKRFFIRKNQITTFNNAKDVIGSQTNLKHLAIERMVIDEDFLEAIAGTKTKSLNIVDTTFRFDSISDQNKEFIKRLQNVSLSRLRNSPSLSLILTNLRDVEILNIHFIHDLKMKPLAERNILQKLITLRMHDNYLITDILNSLTFTDELEEMSCVITHNEQVDNIARTSPRLKRFFMEFSRLDVITQVLKQFKSLELIETRLWCFDLEILKAIMNQSGNLKKALIFIHNNYCDEEDQEDVRKSLHPDFLMTVDDAIKQFEVKNNSYFHLIVNWGKHG